MMITMSKHCGLWTLFLLTVTFPVCAAVEITPLSSYHKYDQLTEFMNYTSRAYPALTHLYTIGQSEQGKKIHSVYRSHETAIANNQYTGYWQTASLITRGKIYITNYPNSFLIIGVSMQFN